MQHKKVSHSYFAVRGSYLQFVKSVIPATHNKEKAPKIRCACVTELVKGVDKKEDE